MLKLMRSKTYQGKLLDSWNEGFATGYDLGLKRRPQAEPSILVDNGEWYDVAVIDVLAGVAKYFGPKFLKAIGLR